MMPKASAEISVLQQLQFVVIKAEHLYSALHGIQTALKRSGMDHTAFNLQRTPCQPLFRKRSPDGASIECGGGYLIAAHYSFIDPKRIKG